MQRRVGCAPWAALVAATLMTAAAQPLAPTSVNVTTGDNALTVSWPAVVNQPGYDTVHRYSILVDPIDVPRVPDLVPTFVDEFDGSSLSGTNWNFLGGPCQYTTIWAAPCRPDQAGTLPTVAVGGGAVTLSSPAGQNMYPLPTFGTSTLLTPANGYGVNGAPILARNNVTFPAGDAATSQTFHTLVRISDPAGVATNISMGGFVVYDYAGGALRPLLRYYLSANTAAAGNLNKLAFRRVSGASPGTATAPVVVLETTLPNSFPAAGIIAAELFLSRDAEGGTWTMGYRWPGQPFPTFAAGVLLDATLGVSNWSPSTTYVGLFADNGGVIDRAVTFDRFAVYSDAMWTAYAGNVSAGVTRNATIASKGLCAVTRTVTRDVAADLTTYTVAGLQNGVQYAVSVRSVGQALSSSATVAPGTYAPVPSLPSISVNQRPALFLDALSLPTGGGLLDRWRDVSGNGRDFIQPSSSLQPVGPNPTAGNPTPFVYFPPTTATEMYQERRESFWDLGSPTFDNHEMTAFVLYQADVQSYYSMNLISKGLPGRAGWQMVAMYSGSTNFGGFRIYGDNTPFVDYPATAPTTWAWAQKAIGISRSWGVVNNPDSYTPTVLTYDYWRRDAVQPWFQIDGCVGVNYGVTSDYCNNPAGDNSIGWNRPFTPPPATTSATRFVPGFNWDRVWGPRFPYMVNNTVVWNSTLLTSTERLKISDAYYGGGSAGGYNQHWLQGRLHAILLYKPRLASRADRQAVQEWLLDRYGQRCTANANPTVNSTCVGSVASGATCTHSCRNNTARVYGPVPNTNTRLATLTCSNGVWGGKGLVCGASCPTIPGPTNVASCRKMLLNEDFSRYAANATSLAALHQYITDPVLSNTAAASRFIFRGDALVGVTPTQDDDCVTVAPTSLMLNAPAWADAASLPVDPVVHDLTFSLDTPNARGGVAFRTLVNGGVYNMYRVSLQVGVPGAIMEKVTGTGTSYAVTAWNSTLLPASFTPVRAAVYRVVCSLRGAELSCTIGLATDAVLSDAFIVSDADIPLGGGGLYVQNGQVAFRKWLISGGCGSLGQCGTTQGQECRYQCAPGYTPSAASSAVQTCGANGTYVEGGVFECRPTPPQLPGGQTFSIPEDAAMGTILGVINGSAFNSGDVLLWEILPQGNNETERNAQGVAIGTVTGVFGITLCAGELFLAKSGIISYDVGTRFYFLKLRARVASNPAVSSDLDIVVNVTNVRNAPYFPADPVTGDNRRYTRSVPENSPVGTAVAPAIAALVPEQGQSAVYSIIFGNTGNVWSINNATGLVSVATPVLNFEVTPVYQIMVRAQDADFPTSGNTVLVDINLVDVNDPPVAANQGLYVSETDAVMAGTIVGTVVATDEDAQDGLTFAIVAGNGPGWFQLGANNGSLTIGNTPPPFSNTSIIAAGATQCRAVYTLLCSVTDTKGPATVQFNVTVYITVGAVNPGTGRGAPQVSVVGMPVVGFNTKGGDVFTVTGANFYPEYAPFRVVFARQASPWRYYNSSACTVVDPDSVSTLSCVSPPGWGLSLLAQVIYGAPNSRSVWNGTVATGSTVIRYAAPRVLAVAGNNSAVDITNLTTSGGQAIVLTMANMGWNERALTHTVRYGPVLQYVATNLARDYVNNLLSFRTVAGVGARLAIQVTVGDQTTTTKPELGEPSISYGKPYIANATGVAASFNFDSLNSNGGQTFYLRGANFGPTGTVVNATLSSTQVLDTLSGTPRAHNFFLKPTSCTVSTAHTRITCTMPPGAGRGHVVTVAVGNQTSDVYPHRTFSYTPPTVTSLGGAGAVNGDTQGGQIVTFSGRNFGPTVLGPGAIGTETIVPIYARYGKLTDANETWYTPTRCTVTTSSTTSTLGTITCFTGPGTGRDLVWRLWVAGQWVQPINTTLLTSYGPPIVSDFATVSAVTNPAPSVYDFDTRGERVPFGEISQEVDIIGRNFGPDPLDTTRFAASYSFTLVQTASAFNSTLVPATSNGLLRFVPSSCRIVDPHVRLRCKVAEGVGAGLEWRLTLNGQNSTTPTMGYLPPAIGSVRNATDGTPITAANTDGGDIVMIRGTNFGPGVLRRANCPRKGVNNTFAAMTLPNGTKVTICYGYVQKLRMGPTGFEDSVAEFTVLNDTIIYAVLPPGFGQDLRFSITVADQASEASVETVSYAKPVVLYVSPTVVDTNPFSGISQSILSVYGLNFGLLDPGTAVGVYLGNAPDGSRTLLLPSAAIDPDPSKAGSVASYLGGPGPRRPQRVDVQLPPGLLPDRMVQVEVFNRANPATGRLASNPELDGAGSFFSYSSPSLSAVVVSRSEDDADSVGWILANVPGAADESRPTVYKLTLMGANFGPNATVTGDAIVRDVELVSDDGTTVDSANIVWRTWNHGVITAYTTVMPGNVRVVSSGLSYNGNATKSVQTDAKHYASLSPQILGWADGATTGPFATSGTDAAGNALYLSFKVTYLQAFSTLTAAVDGRSCPLWLNDLSGPMTDPRGTLTTSAAANGTYYFPSPDNDIAKDYWVLTCKLPPGEGTAASLVVMRDGDSASNSWPITYRPPTVTMVSVWDPLAQGWTDFPVSNGAGAQTTIVVPTEPTAIRISGTDFGLRPRVQPGQAVTLQLCSANVTVSGCTATQATSVAGHSVLVFTSLIGQGTGVNKGTYGPNGYTLVVDVAGQQPTGVILFRYAPPTILTWTRSGPTTGGVQLSLVGRNLGNPAEQTPAVWLGRTTGILPPGMIAIGDSDRAFNAGRGTFGAGPYREVLVTLPEGTGADLDFIVAVDDQTVTVPRAFNYTQPIISAVFVAPVVVRPEATPSIAPSASATPSTTPPPASASGTPAPPPSASGTPAGTASSTGSPAAAASSSASPSLTSSSAPAASPSTGARRLQASDTPSTSASPSTGASPSTSQTPAPSPSAPPADPAVTYAVNMTTFPDGSMRVWDLPTSGGMVMTLWGANFGRRADGSSCLFFAWHGRPDRTLLCDNRTTAVGEGEVPSVAVVEWDHWHISFVLPPGAGLREIVPWVRGQTPLGVLVGVFAPPVITAELEPRLGNTDGGTAVVVRGANLGVAPLAIASRDDTDDLLGAPLPATLDAYLSAPPLPQEMVRVNFARLCFSRYNDSFGFRPAPVAGCGMDVVSHTASAITFRNPPGIGVNRTVSVSVFDRLPNGTFVNFTSNSVLFSYLPPTVLSTQPWPIAMDGTDGKALKLFGINFGRPDTSSDAWTAEELAVYVSIGNDMCANAERAENSRTNEIYLKCAAPNMPVGRKNITYTVAGQTAFNGELSTGAVFAACAGASPARFNPLQVSARPGYYGLPGEMCYACPAGSYCGGFDETAIVPGTQSKADGGTHTYPRPLQFYFNLNDTMLGSCPPKMAIFDKETGAQRDVCIVPCEPKEACVGDNRCAFGYASEEPYFRCASCAPGFYKSANRCIKCPDSPAALFVGAAMLLIAGAGLSYVLNKKKINIGYISIGVDFFQVLALFANSKVKWPPAILELFHILSAFNLNIEIVAPECLIPKLAYRNKWAFIMALPVGICACFLLFHFGFTFYKGAVKGRRRNLQNHIGSLVSSMTMLMYILYIYLTRNVLDVFNCSPTDPDDGKTYLTAVFEECGVPGGTQMTLLPWAIIALLVYVLGYPAAIGTLLWRKRELIMEDQLLRAKGVGNDRLTNPRAYEMRKRYRNVYYQFRPDYIFWALVILLRKFLLAVTLIMFNKNSSFQLAAALLIMFCAYSVQVRTVPYMSPGDYESSIKEHETKAAAGDPLHVKLRESIGKIESRGRKKVHRNIMTASGKVDASAVLGLLTSWLFNYNTTEAVLLFSAVIVALMGLMFAAQDASPSFYSESRDAITSVTLAVVILSILYFFFVVFTEIGILYTEDQRRKALERRQASMRKKGVYSKDEKGRSSETRKKDLAAAAAAMSHADMVAMTGPMEASMNPIFLSGGGQSAAGVMEAIMAQETVPSQELWRLFQSSFIQIQDEIAKVSHTVAEYKVAQQKLEAAAALLAESGIKTKLAEGDRPMSIRAKKKAEYGPTARTPSMMGSVGTPDSYGGGGEDSPAPGTPKMNPLSASRGSMGARTSSQAAMMGGKTVSLTSLRGLKK